MHTHSNAFTYRTTYSDTHTHIGKVKRQAVVKKRGNRKTNLSQQESKSFPPLSSPFLSLFSSNTMITILTTTTFKEAFQTHNWNMTINQSCLQFIPQPAFGVSSLCCVATTYKMETRCSFYIKCYKILQTSP